MITSCRNCTGSNCTDSNCTGSNCTDSNCTGSNCTGSNCTGSNCTGSNWNGSNCTGSNWTGSICIGSNWTGSNRFCNKYFALNLAVAFIGYFAGTTVRLDIGTYQFRSRPFVLSAQPTYLQTKICEERQQVRKILRIIILLAHMLVRATTC